MFTIVVRFVNSHRVTHEGKTALSKDLVFHLINAISRLCTPMKEYAHGKSADRGSETTT
jgi:hypothetical protein